MVNLITQKKIPIVHYILLFYTIDIYIPVGEASCMWVVGNKSNVSVNFVSQRQKTISQEERRERKKNTNLLQRLKIAHIPCQTCSQNAHFLRPHREAANLIRCLDGAGSEAVFARSTAGVGCDVKLGF